MWSEDRNRLLLLITHIVIRYVLQIYWALLVLMYRSIKSRNWFPHIRYHTSIYCFSKYYHSSFVLQLGVNGYSFIVNNNGHVLYHPDLRPLVRNKSNKIGKILWPHIFLVHQWAVRRCTSAYVHICRFNRSWISRIWKWASGKPFCSPWCMYM